jgi:hypothetical protein
LGGEITLRAFLPPSGLRLFAVVDTNGDYLPGPDEPIATPEDGPDDAAPRFVFRDSSRPDPSTAPGLQ